MGSFAQTLRDRISIQSAPAGRDAAGQRIPGGTWSEVRKSWADVRYTGGLEAIRAGAVTGKVNASIRIRYCTDIDASMRVVHGVRAFKILALLPDKGRVYMDLLCEVVT